MEVERVFIAEDWPTGGHRIVIRGRSHPGARMAVLQADGTWKELSESDQINPSGEGLGITLPDGALDAIVAEYLKVAAPQQATERHLEDAMSVRDRLLTIVEREA